MKSFSIKETFGYFFPQIEICIHYIILPYIFLFFHEIRKLKMRTLSTASLSALYWAVMAVIYRTSDVIVNDPQKPLDSKCSQKAISQIYTGFCMWNMYI